MESNFDNRTEFWKAVQEPIELVYEDAYTKRVNKSKQKRFQVQSYKNSQQFNKFQGDFQQDKIDYWQEISRQLLEPEKFIQHNFKFQIFTSQNFLYDQLYKNWILYNNQELPTITITFNDEMKHSNLLQKAQNDIFIQMFLCEQAHSANTKKIKVMKGSLTGETKKKCTTFEKIIFNKLSLHLLAETDKNYNFIIVIYQQNHNQKNYHYLIISQDISIIQKRNCIKLTSANKVYPYFKLFPSKILQQSPFKVNLNKSDADSYGDQVNIFQNVLTHRNKKITNLFYLAYKYSYFVELYYRKQKQEQNALQKVRNLLLNVDVLLTRLNHDPNQGLLCNYVNPQSKFILKINCKLRKVRFLIQKKFTNLISIINSQESFENEDYQKFHSLEELVKFYQEIYSEAELIPDKKDEFSQSQESISIQLQEKEKLQQFQRYGQVKDIPLLYRAPEFINQIQERRQYRQQEQIFNQQRLKKNQAISKMISKQAFDKRQMQPQLYQKPGSNQIFRLIPNPPNFKRQMQSNRQSMNSYQIQKRQENYQQIPRMRNPSYLPQSNILPNLSPNQSQSLQHYRPIQYHQSSKVQPQNRCSCCYPISPVKSIQNRNNCDQYNNHKCYICQSNKKTQNSQLISYPRSSPLQNRRDLERPSTQYVRQIMYQPRKYLNNSEPENYSSRQNIARVHTQYKPIRIISNPPSPQLSYRSVSIPQQRRERFYSQEYIPPTRSIIPIQRGPSVHRLNSQRMQPPPERHQPIIYPNISMQRPRQQPHNRYIFYPNPEVPQPRDQHGNPLIIKQNFQGHFNNKQQ